MSKGLPPQQVENVRRFTKELIDREFGGNANDAAKSLKISQSALSTLLSGKSGVGMKFLSVLSSFSGVPLDQIVSGADKGPVPTRTVLDSTDRWNRVRDSFFVEYSSKFDVEEVRDAILAVDTGSHRGRTLSDSETLALYVEALKKQRARSRGKVIERDWTGEDE